MIHTAWRIDRENVRCVNETQFYTSDCASPGIGPLAKPGETWDSG
jgi:hypothetical protein